MQVFRTFFDGTEITFPLEGDDISKGREYINKYNDSIIIHDGDYDEKKLSFGEPFPFVNSIANEN